MLLIYGLVAVSAVLLGSWAPLTYWLIPRIVGEPWSRWLRVAEHVGCEEGPNPLENTRTILTNPLMKALCWNMNYHAEHHLYAAVPFHALPAAHGEVGGVLRHELGYFAVHRDIIRFLRAHEATPRHEPE